jgi:hypothetical protein
MPAVSDIENWWLLDPANDPSCFSFLVVGCRFLLGRRLQHKYARIHPE